MDPWDDLHIELCEEEKNISHESHEVMASGDSAHHSSESGLTVRRKRKKKRSGKGRVQDNQQTSRDEELHDLETSSAQRRTHFVPELLSVTTDGVENQNNPSNTMTKASDQDDALHSWLANFSGGLKGLLSIRSENVDATANVSSSHSAHFPTTPTANTSVVQHPQSETDIFLDNLDEEIYKGILQNLCPDNIKGSYCHTPHTCMETGRFFACPDHATGKGCSHTSFSHLGHVHLLDTCETKEGAYCHKRKLDSSVRACWVEVVQFHVRANCVNLRGRKTCGENPCRWGHDYAQIRKRVAGL